MLRSAMLLSLAAVAAMCAPQNAAQKIVPIRAAIGLLDSDQTAGFPSNRTPFVWLNLEGSRIKPVGLTLVNPSRETQWTTAQVARWTALAGAPPIPVPPRIGPPVAATLMSKRDAPYWEFPVTTASDEALANLDVLLLPAYGNVSINPFEREKLRRFMDKGGVCWIDVSGTVSLDAVNNLPIPFSVNNIPGATPFSLDYSQPLITYPVGMSQTDALLMQSENTVGVRDLDLAALGLGGIEPLLQTLRPDSLRLQPVVVDPLGIVAAVGRVGDGYMVVTSRGIARTMNRIPLAGGGYSPNDGAQAITPVYDRSSDAAAKLIVNLIHLTSGFSQGAKGSRGARSTPIDLNAPQLRRFADTSTSFAPAGTNGYVPPVVHKGTMVICSQNQIWVYDTNPRQDLDGDGDTDDGQRDYAQGRGFDLLWVSNPLAGPISAPCVTEVPDAATPNLRDQVLVVDANGTLNGFSLFRYDVNGRINGASAAPDYTVVPSTGAASYDFGQPGAGPYAPVMHDGIAFIADTQDSGLNKVGRMWMADPATGQQVRTGGTGWSIGGATAGGIISDVSGPPTVGYIPILDNSGGLDRVAYLPTRPGPAGPTATAGLTSVWIGVKGERPSTYSDTGPGGILTVQTRAASQGLDVYVPGPAEPKSLGIRLVVLRPNGDPLTAAEMNNNFTGGVTQVNGILNFTLTGSAALPVGYTVRIDYTLDLGTGSPALTSQVVRGQLNLPDEATRSRRVLHSISLSPRGTMHLVMSSQVSSTALGTIPGGSYFAIREEGRGNFRVLNRFDLFEPHTINLNQANDVNYPETLLNSDPLVKAPSPVAAFLGGRMQRLTFMSAPSIANDTVYVTAKGIKPLGLFSIPYTIVMAFPAEPEASEIRVTDLNGGFTILQPDMARSTFTAGTWVPDTYTVLQPNQYTYARGESGGVIRIENLSATSRGPIINCMSTSQPIIIRRNGQPDLLIEPNAAASKWNRMLWYTVFSGVDNNSPVVVTGRTLFMAGASSWPTILAGAGFAPSGQVFGMDAQMSPNDPYLLTADTARPWMKQAAQLVFNGPLSVRPNPAFRWPQLNGTTSFEDYKVRLQQTVLQIPGGGYAGQAWGVTGGDGALFTWANEGVWAFAKADFVIADEGRVARFDSVGNPIWSVTGTYKSGRQGDVGGASEVKPLVRPTRCYPIGDRQSLVVDTGANRVIRMDTSGRELRSIGEFQLDPTFRPEGFESNENQTLNAPRDVVTYGRVVPAASNPMSDAQPYEYWNHYLIADTGNRRLVEVVDRYSYDLATRQTGNPVVYLSNGKPAIGVLFWHSQAAYSGGRFAYTSVARAFVDDPLNPRYVYAAAMGDALPARADVGLDAPAGATERRSEDGNGGIVLFDGATSTVITSVNVPPVVANAYFNPSTGTFNSPAEPAHVRRLGNLNSISLRMTNNGASSVLSIMFTDGEGVWEITGAGTTWDVGWMLPKKVYTAIRRDVADNVLFPDNPLDFRATYAKRLDSGEVLVCNGYTGWYQRNLATDPRVRFTGEVLLIDGDFDPTNTAAFGFGFGKLNLGFKTLSIRAQLDNRPGADRDARGIVLPLFADRQ